MSPGASLPELLSVGFKPYSSVLQLLFVLSMMNMYQVYDHYDTHHSIKRTCS